MVKIEATEKPFILALARKRTLQLMAIVCALLMSILPLGATQSNYSDQQAKAIAHQAISAIMPLVGPINILSFSEAATVAFDERSTGPITLVVGDSRISPDFDGLPGNCQATAKFRLIKCDLKLLDDLLSDFAIAVRSIQGTSSNIVLFRVILSHEIGHVILGHSSANYHGTKDGFSISKYINYQHEILADEFAINILDRAGKGTVEYQTLLLDLTREAVRRSLCPQSYPDNCPCEGYSNPASCSKVAAGPGLPLAGDEVFPVVLTGTHPEYIFRFAHMLYMIKDARFSKVFRPQVEAIIRRIKVQNENGEAESASMLLTK